jgi:hypothetical protein
VITKKLQCNIIWWRINHKKKYVKYSNVLKENITNTIRHIPKEKYRNIIKGAYERPEKYISKKNNTRKNQE